MRARPVDASCARAGVAHATTASNTVTSMKRNARIAILVASPPPRHSGAAAPRAYAEIHRCA